LSPETHTRITTPFGFATTAAEVVDGLDLTGRRAIVTGGASGIGIETARALASVGVAVTIAARDTAKGTRVAADIRQTTGNHAIDVRPLELVDLASIRAFVADWDGPLDLLIDNAGVMALPERQLTPAGWELQFATNHLGHFALAVGLHGALAAAGDARIVSLSSRGHLCSPVVFEDVNFAARPYDPFLAYGQSKTANVLFAVGATARWSADGIIANAVHPGPIMTPLTRHLSEDYLRQLESRIRHFKTPEQGAATSVFAAVSPLLDGVGGRYFEDVNESVVLDEVTPEATSGVAAYALDAIDADRLWELSEEATRA
jgi:NAD(P)-dependent dehydrogenase (short-subunit alcohol dehydrogenase family)